MSRRFVAVIGTVNHDVIVDRDGGVRESLGGILYNAMALGALLEGSGIGVRLIGRLGEEHRREAARVLAPFPHVETGTLIADPAGTNESRLDYSGGGDRQETVGWHVAPLSVADLASARGAAAVLVNMISGEDLAPETAEALAGLAPGRRFLDVQALARTREVPRRNRIVPGGPRWARAFAVVRGNEEEIAHLGGVPADADEAAARLLEWGTEEVVVTRAERGSTRFAPGAARLDVPSAPCARPVDPTGCGDSFLSALVAAHLLGLDPEAALRLASFVSAEVLAASGLPALTSLRGVRQRAAAALGDVRIASSWPRRAAG